MNGLAGYLRDLAQTAFRLFPWPTETGLRTVGRPGPESPVLVTGNYDLTVRRLLRALEGIDAWVVVAPSRGINVWCAAAGGLLTTSHVVTALKTSGIAERVRHRRAILPQLAATGVIARDVSRRCGWKVRFGPVYAEDLPRYLTKRAKKDDSMRSVRFTWRERIEMAVAWAAPMSIVLGGLLAVAGRSWALAAVGASWVIAPLCFFVYDRLGALRWLKFWATSAGGAAAVSLALGAGAWSAGAAALLATLVVGIVTFDYDGSTPIQGGSHFESRRWHITLDLERCAGVYTCWAVCPEACFEKRTDLRKVALAHDERCIKCGACIVQCPQDALFFTDHQGRKIEPATIRRYKLNLLGTRGVVVADT